MIDSSPSSAESSFRELDEVFLQTQTRIWLGEVLNTRLDEDLHISDLLQDGEILYEVSKIVWNLLLTKSIELRHLRHKYGPFGSKKSSGRYRPYSNVDSFLKICKILGLSGIDLFSPSDVVEKRNIRKVCICIRSLSKKVRSKLLSVPDFDMVIYSVSMPTDMVGVIRKSLESSQCTLSSSSSHSFKGSRTKLKQKDLPALSSRDDDDSSSDASDEAESRYMGDQESSPEPYNSVQESDVKCQPQSSLENDGSVMGDSSCIDVGESNYISDYLAFSDLMVHATDGSDCTIRDGENNMFDFFLNAHSEGLNKNGKFSDDEDMEVSSTTSMSSVLGRLLNLEFDDQFDEEDEQSSTNIHHKDSSVKSESPKVDTFESKLSSSISEADLSTTVSGDNPRTPEDSSPAEHDAVSVNEEKNTSPRPKHSRKPLLKTVVKGTAIAGVVFLLLHIRKNKGINGQENKQETRVLNYSGSKSSSTKQQRGNTSKGIYPAQKIKL